MKQLISLATALLLLSPELASQEKTSLRVDFRMEVAKYRAKLGEGNVAGFEAEMNAALVPTLSHQIGFLSFDASTDDLVLRVSLRDKLEEDAEARADQAEASSWNGYQAQISRLLAVAAQFRFGRQRKPEQRRLRASREMHFGRHHEMKFEVDLQESVVGVQPIVCARKRDCALVARHFGQ